MTAYFDTSALVPLVIAEASSPVCARAWGAADVITASSLSFVETHAALAQAARLQRITEEQLDQALEVFDRVWEQMTAISPSDDIIRHAAQLGRAHALRGYDAVHCASALAIDDEKLFAVSGDDALLAAWHSLGVATVDTNQDAA